ISARCSRPDPVDRPEPGVSLMDSAEALALGLQYHQKGQLVQAEQIYQQLLQTDSTNADALLYLGAVYMAQGRFAEAAANFQQVLSVRPDFVELYNDLGVAF